MIAPLVLGIWVVVGGGIWLYENQKKRERKKAQEFEDKWLGRNQQEEKKDG